MENFFKIKKRKFLIFSLLFFNQLLFNGYALNNKKTDLGKSDKNKLEKNYYKSSNILIAEKNKFQNTIRQETKEIENFAKEIEDFLEETLELDYYENLNSQKNQEPLINENIEELMEKPRNKDNEGNQEPLINENIEELMEKPRNKDNEGNQEPLINENIEELIEKPRNKDNEANQEPLENNNVDSLEEKSTNKEVIIQMNNLKAKGTNKLLLPSKSIISSTEFKVPSRGYVKLNGPKITLNLSNVDSIETLKTIAKIGDYGIIIVDEKNSNEEKSKNKPKITANFENVEISDVFNSILLSSNLQAILENNIIFVGEYILNKSLKPRVSKTFRLNQVNAASVADYLSTLGAQISKVSVISGSIAGREISDSFLNKKIFKDEPINSYGIEGGPLFGLIGTADLRLQTITLIGTNDLMLTAEKYIKNLDIRHKQVALTIKMIDVNLTKTDIKNNAFEFRTGDSYFINRGGLSLTTGNSWQGAPSDTSGNFVKLVSGGIAEGNFLNWLEAKITNENAKILASPTLILGENSNVLASGAATVDDSLSTATIGRPFKNEGFIKVGETVVTGFEQSSDEGVVTCTATEGTAGITFGAKVDKIDDNGFVTFALSPAISSVTKSVEISGCGIQNTLSVRKLDTGSIRVKNGDTLVLTGVLQDSDSVTTSKVPILGDIPIFGSLFRNNSTQKRKSELIILVTPKILKDR